uniref:Uncharacterized protein n=1 Tax=Physcomitrium patens TaxID=3218 RepID=A0A2K1LBI3_PHYPA|nr:hypothetical protein PHYPA_001808 [Physcomitrium patens]
MEGSVSGYGLLESRLAHEMGFHRIHECIPRLGFHASDLRASAAEQSRTDGPSNSAIGSFSTFDSEPSLVPALMLRILSFTKAEA